MTSVLSLQPSASLSFAPCKNTSQTNLSAQPFCHWPSSRGKTIGFYHWFLPSIIGPVNWPLNQFLYLLFDVGVPSFDAPFIIVRALRGSFARFFLGFFSIAKKSAAWLLTGWLWWGSSGNGKYISLNLVSATLTGTCKKTFDIRLSVYASRQ